VSVHCFSAILIKRGVLLLIGISVLSLKDSACVSLIDTVISIALKSVKFRFREYGSFPRVEPVIDPYVPAKRISRGKKFTSTRHTTAKIGREANAITRCSPNDEKRSRPFSDAARSRRKSLSPRSRNIPTQSHGRTLLSSLAGYDVA